MIMYDNISDDGWVVNLNNESLMRVGHKCMSDKNDQNPKILLANGEKGCCEGHIWGGMIEVYKCGKIIQ